MPAPSQLIGLAAWSSDMMNKMLGRSSLAIIMVGLLDLTARLSVDPISCLFERDRRDQQQGQLSCCIASEVYTYKTIEACP